MASQSPDARLATKSMNKYIIPAKESSTGYKLCRLNQDLFFLLFYRREEKRREEKINKSNLESFFHLILNKLNLGFDLCRFY